MIKAIVLPIDIDLFAFSQVLSRRGIVHRINEEAGHQIIWVRSEKDSYFVREAWKIWLELAEEEGVPPGLRRPLFHPAGWPNAVFKEILLCPFTMLLILTCVLVAAVSRLGAEAWRVDFLFYPMLATESLGALFAGLGNPLLFARALAPMFLHFGELHLLFNMLWLWYFGRQLEPRQARWLYPTMVLFASFTANTAQYLLGGGNNFGGMSGVVYGLLGYAWILQRIFPSAKKILSDQIFIVFIVMLVAMELLASSWIATAAHLGGLLAGLFLGMVVAAALIVRAKTE